MIVYSPNTSHGQKKKGTHTLYVCPAGDPDRKGECPSEWVNDRNEPVNFPVEFRNGRAEVPDNLGRYMIERGLARKTKLILPEAA